MKHKIVFGLIFILTATFSSAQKINIDSLFSNFKQASFYEQVYPAKIKLESYQKRIIPQLIELLYDTNFVKLTGTADLIYPGATQYYGHGRFIPYDMDWISVRAGWLLEDLTFMDFGYKTSGVDDKTLFNLMKDNDRYKQYLKKGAYDLEWKQKPAREKLIEFRKILAENVSKWWQVNQDAWTRLSAIKEALQSNNENRLSEVFQFLRHGKTRCDNLNSNLYLSEIRPLVALLKKAKYKRLKTEVDLLLRDDLEIWTNNMVELEKEDW